MEDRDTIAEAIQGADMLFITAGMGGGTGTGAAPVVAEVARELGILTVAVVTKPFSFEGKRRMRVAEEGIAALEKNVDSLITIPNEKLLPVLGSDATLMQAFEEANNVLQGAGSWHRRLDCPSRHHERRLCRRAYGDECDGSGHDGNQHGQRSGSCDRSD